MARREALSVAEESRLPAPTGGGRKGRGVKWEEEGEGQAVLVARQRKSPEMSWGISDSS